METGMRRRFLFEGPLANFIFFAEKIHITGVVRVLELNRSKLAEPYDFQTPPRAIYK